MRIESQYAQAMYHFPRENWEVTLRALETVTEDQHFKNVIKNPQLSQTAVMSMLDSCLGTLSKTQRNLVALMVKNRRLDRIRAIRKLFQKMQRTKNKEQLIVVQTAHTPTPKQKSLIESFAGTHTPKHYKPVFVYETNPKLIGGFVLNINDKIINKSVHQRLRTISQNIDKR